MPLSTPFTGEKVASFNDVMDDEVRDAISAAHQAFLGWRETPFADRYARLLTLEMGKLTAEARAEVELSAKSLE